MERQSDVTLINMPYGPLFVPSMGLGLLKAALSRCGIGSRTYYFNLQFAAIIGEKLYLKIQDETYPYDLVGEWTFTGALQEEVSESEVQAYVEQVLRGHGRIRPHSYASLEPYSETLIQQIVAVRQTAEAFIETCLQQVIEQQPRIIGFTSTFQQQVASLALARRIKSLLPETFIVFGGPNCEGVMGQEMIRQYDFIDAVVSGEADFVFPELVQRVLAARPLTDLSGVFSRARPASRTALPMLNELPGKPPMIEDLDVLPIPEFDEYFDEFDRQFNGNSRKPSLLFETSRGCWWGEKHHCTFCGLNGGTMTFRSKTAQRAMDELTYLTERHPGHSVNVVDNILDMTYFKDFVPLLAERRLGLNLFYEVKANLRKDQLRLLHQAGITAIQPGIESLSDQVLQIMRKGVKALQNIQLIKWCKELGITPYWHLIWGFPGESAQEYEQMRELIPLLTHLPPPNGSGPIRVDRFSPNFDQSAEMGLMNLSPYPAYQHVYRLKRDALMNLSYYFTFEHRDDVDVLSYVKPFLKEVMQWRRCHGESALIQMDKGNRLLIWDWRPIAKQALTVLTGHRKFAYQACDQMRTARQVMELWQKESGASITRANFDEALEELTASGLMIKRDELFLALALPAPSNG